MLYEVITRAGKIWSRDDDVTLTATDGSIVDAPTGASAAAPTGDAEADVLGNHITLLAELGAIGRGTNFLEIDSSYAASGYLTALAQDNIFISETAGDLNLYTVESTTASAWLRTDAGSRITSYNVCYTKLLRP